MESNKTVRPKSGRSHLRVEVVMSLREVLDYKRDLTWLGKYMVLWIGAGVSLKI